MSDWAVSYNARSISPAQIASLFVRPPYFEDVLRFQNVVLVGPRGSGKTTILKLLTPTGLYHWSLKSTSQLEEINYLPIYIPSDTLWKGETSAIEVKLGSSAIAETIQDGVFLNYCLYQIISGLEEAKLVADQLYGDPPPAWSIRISRAQEGRICESLSDFWQLKRCEYSFLGLKLGLLNRMNFYSSYIHSFAEPPHTDLLSEPVPNVLVMFRGFFDVIESITGHNKWSLNFDEMEIAPTRTLRLLYESLRSFDQRAVLKFSLFPYAHFMGPRLSNDRSSHSFAVLRVVPVEGQDYKAVRLGGKLRVERDRFAENIVQGICHRRGVEFQQFVDYVDRSTQVNKFRSRQGTQLVRNYKRLFGALYAKDRSFRKYIVDNGIAVSLIDTYDEQKKASLIRKVAPIAEFRNSYLRERPGRFNRPYKRSRKGYSYYHGFSQLLKLTESNPRALNFYVSDLIDSLDFRTSETAQNIIIPKNVDRFRAMVATQVVPRLTQQSYPQNALNVVDILGQHLSRLILGHKFLTEPPLSYKLGNLDETVLELIGIGINTGALIIDGGPSDQALMLDLLDARVRVSHQLAPFYPLPTITGQYIAIQMLPPVESLTEQPDLLGWGSDDK